MVTAPLATPRLIHFYVWFHGDRAVYVGQACDIERRRKRHLRAPGALGRFLRAHEGDCSMEMLDTHVIDVPQGPRSVLVENRYIDFYGTHAPSGFNLQLARCSGLLDKAIMGVSARKAIGYSHSAETRAKISMAAVARFRDPEQRENRRRFCLEHESWRVLSTPEANAKKRAFHLGSKRSEESRKRMSLAAKARQRASFLGHRHTEKARRKLSEQKRGEHHPFFGKKRPEHAARMREIWSLRPHPASGRAPWNKGIKTGIEPANKGKHHSEDTRRKMSQAARLRLLRDGERERLIKLLHGDAPQVSGQRVRR